VTIPLSRSFDVTASINDLLRDYPSSIVALDAYGIDSCCGGDLTIREAARGAGVSLDILLDDIEQALRHGAR
jgi:iron-sulfur cluster repair protein YtfE (RIC family)